MKTNLVYHWRQMQLSYEAWRYSLLSYWNRLHIYWEQKTCPHIWQAALINRNPGRTCKLCDLVQQLSREDFYAQFGERYQAMLHQSPVAPVICRESSVSHIEIERIQ